jgi:hypothetical protein
LKWRNNSTICESDDFNAKNSVAQGCSLKHDKECHMGEEQRGNLELSARGIRKQASSCGSYYEKSRQPIDR